MAVSVLALAFVDGARAASAVPMGTAGSYAVLAGSTITNTGSTTITGDIGLCCTGLATTGFGPGANQVNQSGGALYVGTGSPAAAAQDDLDTAYGFAAGEAVTNTVGVDLSLSGTPANPLPPGVYQSPARGAFQINTGLTLDFQGDPNAVFVFQGTTLTTAVGPAGSINIVNGGSSPSSCHIYWQLADATQGVTLGTSSAFKGTTLSLGASVLGTGATVEGSILTRRSKAVNLDTNTITRATCATPASAPPPPPVAASPAPVTAPPASVAPVPAGPAVAAPVLAPVPRAGSCLHGFHGAVTGESIRRVVFSMGGKVIGTRGRAPFEVFVAFGHGFRTVFAYVTFTDGRPAVTLRLPFKLCAAAARRVHRRVSASPPASQPPRRTGGFTG